jgi:phosphoribosylamine--glycine ligase
MQACANGTLADTEVKFSDGSACCVIMASDGYPQKYASGFEITVDADLEAEVYVAGAKLDAGKMLSAGGRVLGVTATSNDLKSAIDKAYANVPKVHFENAYYRHDIGKRALAANSEN